MPTIEETTIVLHLDDVVGAAIVGASLEMDRALRGDNPPSAGQRASAAFVRGAAYAGAVLHLNG
jgi:hypothetical protein